MRCGEPVEDRLDLFVASERENAEMPDDVVGLNAGLAGSDQGFIHGEDVGKPSFVQFDVAGVVVMGRQ